MSRLMLPLRAVLRDPLAVSGWSTIEDAGGCWIGAFLYDAHAEEMARRVNGYETLVHAMSVIRSQSLGPDWTAEQAMAWIKDYIGETLERLPK